MFLALAIIGVLILFFIWFAGSFVYRPIGKLFKRMYKDAREAVEQTDEEDHPKEENKNNFWYRFVDMIICFFKENE